MAKKFNFGKISHLVKANVVFAGQQGTVSHDRIVKPALFENDSETTYEFGEVVVIVKDTATNYVVEPVKEATTNTAKLGVIMNEIAGATHIRQGVIDTALENVALNIWAFDDNVDAIGVPVFENGTATKIGGAVFLGTGKENTSAGALYTKAVGSGGTVALTNLEWKSVAGKPTLGDQLTALVGRK